MAAAVAAAPGCSRVWGRPRLGATPPHHHARVWPCLGATPPRKAPGHGRSSRAGRGTRGAGARSRVEGGMEGVVGLRPRRRVLPVSSPCSLLQRSGFLRGRKERGEVKRREKRAAFTEVAIAMAAAAWRRRGREKEGGGEAWDIWGEEDVASVFLATWPNDD